MRVNPNRAEAKMKLTNPKCTHKEVKECDLRDENGNCIAVFNESCPADDSEDLRG